MSDGFEYPSYVLEPNNQLLNAKTPTTQGIKYLQIPLNAEADLFHDHTQASNFPENNTPYSNFHKEVIPENEVEAYFIQLEKPKNEKQKKLEQITGIENEEYKPEILLKINEEVHKTSPGTAFLYGSLTENLSWKNGKTHLFETEEEIEEDINNWVELSLEELQTSKEDSIPINQERNLEEITYKNGNGQTNPVLRFEDLTLGLPPMGQNLQSHYNEALLNSLEEGEYQGDIPPSHILNEDGNNEFSDYVDVMTELMPEEYDIVLDIGEKPRFKLYNPDEENLTLMPTEVAFNYILENGQTLRTTAEFDNAKARQDKYHNKQPEDRMYG